MRWSAEPPVEPADASRRATEILGRPEFRTTGPTPLQRALAAVGRFFARIFGWLAGRLPRAAAGGGGGANVVGWVLVLAAVGVVVVLVVRSRRRRPAAAEAEPDEPAPTVEARRSGDAWRVEAAAHAAAGRWREALRCRYRAVVAELVDRGVVGGTAGETTGHERAQVAERLPELGGPFAGLSDEFDEVVYGGAPVGPEVVGRADELDRRVEAL